MSDFDEKIIERLRRLEREVERLQVKERPVVITDHGALTGLGDDDHPQYLLTTGKAADSDKLDGKDSTYFAPASSVVTDHGALTGLADNDHPQYLLTTGKAADSDKLDNIDSSGFVQTSGNQTIAGIKTFSSFPVTPSSAPSSNYQTANKKYVDDLIGAWASWTPTVTYLGGTTDPKSLTVDHARYCRTGNTVTFSIVATVERGSGNRTVVTFSLPLTAKYANFAASGTEDITSTTPKACGCYSDNAKRVLVRFATAMANDGKIRVSGSYEV